MGSQLLEAASLSIASTARRNRERVIDTMAHTKLEQSGGVNGVRLALQVCGGTHKIITSITPG